MGKNEKISIGILLGGYIVFTMLIYWISLERFLREGTVLNSFIGVHFNEIALLGFAIVLCYCFKIYITKNGNKKGCIVRFINIIEKYSFLFEQLLIRDFKSKYKRSVLGILWSLLNPMLTMSVQYIVFSTIFKSNIEYFPVYLLIGVIMFGFFTECCSMGITSITGNSALITKVYIPKYIYPVTRVLSSTINLLLSLVPLIIMVIVMKIPINKSVILVVLGLIFLIVFCIGMSLLLSTMMVFFRDTQFLWGVISTLWMYATPIFYPETIWPEQYKMILKANPMYHIIRFIRTCIIEGQSPDAQAFIYCIIFSFGTLALGAFVFKKNQDKFVLNL